MTNKLKEEENKKHTNHYYRDGVCIRDNCGKKEEEKSQCCENCSDLSQSYKMPCVNTDCKCHIPTPEEAGKGECICERFSYPMYHVSDDPHSVEPQWTCPIHGLQKKYFLIHTEKQSYCKPCNEESLPQHKDSWEERFDIKVKGLEVYRGVRQEAYIEVKDMFYIKQFISQIRTEGYHDGFYDASEKIQKGLKGVFKEEE